MVRSALLAATLVLSGGFAAHAQDLEVGKKIFVRCQVCHMAGPGAKVRVGPVLNGVVGRTPGTYAGFKYSTAMVDYGKSHVWDAATLETYLTDPKKTVPGNKMAFPGLKKPEERAAVIAYLSTFAADGSTTTH